MALASAIPTQNEKEASTKHRDAKVREAIRNPWTSVCLSFPQLHAGQALLHCTRSVAVSINSGGCLLASGATMCARPCQATHPAGGTLRSRAAPSRTGSSSRSIHVGAGACCVDISAGRQAGQAGTWSAPGKAGVGPQIHTNNNRQGRQLDNPHGVRR